MITVLEWHTQTHTHTHTAPCEDTLLHLDIIALWIQYTGSISGHCPWASPMFIPSVRYLPLGRLESECVCVCAMITNGSKERERERETHDPQRVRVGQAGVGREGVATERALCVQHRPIQRSNWLMRLWQSHLFPPPSTGRLPKVCVCVCVCAREPGRLNRATEAGSNSNPMSLQPSHSHTHTRLPLCRRLSLQTQGLGRRRRRGRERGERERERQRVAEREKGVREERGRGRLAGCKGEHHGFRSGSGRDAAMDYITTGSGHCRKSQQRR